jgi:hypothetical protein
MPIFMSKVDEEVALDAVMVVVAVDVDVHLLEVALILPLLLHELILYTQQ